MRKRARFPSGIDAALAQIAHVSTCGRMFAAMIEPPMTNALEFRIGDVFPSSDPVGRWLSVCCMALNDLLFVNRELLPRLQGDAPPWENQYLGRLAGSHLYEASKFLGQAERRYGEDLRPFLDRLPDDAKRNYEAAKAVGPGNHAPFAEQLARLRNHFFHYAQLIPQAPQYEELSRALEGHAELCSRIAYGDMLMQFRAEFADDIGAALAFEGDEGLSEFITALANSIVAFWRFVYAALVQYLEGKPFEVVDR